MADAVTCSINMRNLRVGACGREPKRITGCWKEVTCAKCLGLWGGKPIKCPCVECKAASRG